MQRACRRHATKSRCGWMRRDDCSAKQRRAWCPSPLTWATPIPAISRNSSEEKRVFPQAITVGSVDAATRRTLICFNAKTQRRGGAKSCNSCLVLTALPSAWFAASRRGFGQQFLTDSFDVLWLQADRADNAFAVNDSVGRIIVHGPRFLGFQF